jgi:fatty acid desaturase
MDGIQLDQRQVVDKAPPERLTADDFKAEIRRLHANDEASFLPHHLATLAYLACMAAAVWSWTSGAWLITLFCWGLGGHVGHSKLIAFHEAAHGTLSSRRWLNEFQGIMLGVVILVPLSVYRFVHAQHHAHLGSTRDLEMWPFVCPGTSRFWRLLAATAELTIGFFYTPVVFLHGVLTAQRLPKRQARRMLGEYLFALAIWTVIFTLAQIYGWWEALIVGYFVPATIAGNLQSLRKFTEHMGLLGDSILTVTRTVVDERWFGRLMSDSMLHIDYHATHHRYAKVPHYNLPAATPYVYAEPGPAIPIYPTYTSAMLDMLRGLGDPRVGHQWVAHAQHNSAAIPCGQ